ncbi:AlbA family DNA-binding domain-containing protein [Cystobacter fuscus]|uniref:AlbA family DNA-binding domain-containing protein n=1 Tax=Cystobacter fuscus TaxID=43 RepID=UPI00097151FF|nr:ATP-binding protein [Cystobacter fuscus]
MTSKPWEWQESDLQNLVGQQESSRLEFKSKKLLDEHHKNAKKLADILTPEVSAFANSEGGTIVIGIEEEKKGKGGRYAVALEGVGTELISPEWLQQVIESNLRPYLPGLRLKRVVMAEGTQVAYVISVPRGSTAYQASDFLYYGRSEFEAKPLPDHEIRLRMMQGRVPRARIVVCNVSQTASAEEKDQKARALVAGIEDPVEKGIRLIESGWDGPALYDEYKVDLALMNEGELTIRDFLARVHLSCSPEFDIHDDSGRKVNEIILRLQSDLNVLNVGTATYHPGEKKVFPGSAHQIGACMLVVPKGKAIAAGNFKANWRVYMDDTQPIFDEMELGLECEHWLARGK